MSFKAKWDEKRIKQIVALAKELKEAPIDKDTASQIGQDVTEKMVSSITKGISPIRGAGRFPAYKNKNKYPGDLKPARPVNLKLTGDFLNDLTYKVTKGKYGYKTEISYGAAGSLSDLKESGHRDGVNGQLKRPTIPAIGEQFIVAIERLYTKIFKERIRDLIKKSR